MRVNIAHATPPCPCPHNFLSCSRFHRSQSFIFKSTPLQLRSSYFNDHHFPKHNKNHPKKLHLPCTPLTTSSRDFDLLEPSFPDWPSRDHMIRDSIARRASSIDIPLSLRMIKMKHRFQRLEEEIEIGDFLGDNLNFNTNYPITNLCCSTLYIIKEVHSQALKIRGFILDEDLNGIVGKVQKEMTSSFVWLFRHVFAKTPDLMLQLMLLTSNFATHSIGNYPSRENPNPNLGIDEKLETNLRDWEIGGLELGKSGVPTREILEEMDEIEVGLWNSMVEEANYQRRGDHGKDEGLGFVVDCGHIGLIEHKFVSPVKVEIEGDDYEEYHKTDLLYQIGLSEDPNNSLLLSNYGQFLRLVSRDYDRAEECFKRAIQSGPTDAEIISQYANFLWVVRKDVCGAEEQFQQAMATEPSNSYHASKYASFLWSTGSEDVCHILDPHYGKS